MVEPSTVNRVVEGSSPSLSAKDTMLGFLVVTVWTMVSKLQDSSNKRQMDSPRLKYLIVHVAQLVERRSDTSEVMGS